MHVGSPPHTRGILCNVVNDCRPLGITPAHAGNTATFSASVTAMWDHPRTRGEYLAATSLSNSRWGSPPHTRGIRVELDRLDVVKGITPAHAGNTFQYTSSGHFSKDHPRTRGEYELSTYVYAKDKGSPPHTRGILANNLPCTYYSGITPAHAGNTLIW